MICDTETPSTAAITEEDFVIYCHTILCDHGVHLVKADCPKCAEGRP